MLEQVREARLTRDRSQRAFDKAVREAVLDRGSLTVREIAEAAGLSRERAYQIARASR